LAAAARTAARGREFGEASFRRACWLRCSRWRRKARSQRRSYSSETSFQRRSRRRLVKPCKATIRRRSTGPDVARCRRAAPSEAIIERGSRSHSSKSGKVNLQGWDRRRRDARAADESGIEGVGPSTGLWRFAARGVAHAAAGVRSTATSSCRPSPGGACADADGCADALVGDDRRRIRGGGGTAWRTLHGSQSRRPCRGTGASGSKATDD